MVADQGQGSLRAARSLWAQRAARDVRGPVVRGYNQLVALILLLGTSLCVCVSLQQQLGSSLGPYRVLYRIRGFMQQQLLLLLQ